MAVMTNVLPLQAHANAVIGSKRNNSNNSFEYTAALQASSEVKVQVGY